MSTRGCLPPLPLVSAGEISAFGIEVLGDDGDLLWAVQEDVLDMSEPASVTHMARTGAIVVAGLDAGDGYVVRSFFPR